MRLACDVLLVVFFGISAVESYQQGAAVLGSMCVFVSGMIFAIAYAEFREKLR